MKESQLAKVSLILGIIGFIFMLLPCFSVFGIPMVIGGFICSVIAKMNEDTSSTATASVIINSIALAIMTIWFFTIYTSLLK